MTLSPIEQRLVNEYRALDQRYDDFKLYVHQFRHGGKKRVIVEPIPRIDVTASVALPTLLD